MLNYDQQGDSNRTLNLRKASLTGRLTGLVIESRINEASGIKLKVPALSRRSLSITYWSWQNTYLSLMGLGANSDHGDGVLSAIYAIRLHSRALEKQEEKSLGSNSKCPHYHRPLYSSLMGLRANCDHGDGAKHRRQAKDQVGWSSLGYLCYSSPLKGIGSTGGAGPKESGARVCDPHFYTSSAHRCVLGSLGRHACKLRNVSLVDADGVNRRMEGRVECTGGGHLLWLSH